MATGTPKMVKTLAAVGAALAAGLALGFLLRPSAPAVVPVYAELGVQRDLEIRAVAVAPDGSRVVYAASDGLVTRLYVQLLSELATRVLEGTEGAEQPFFSPDGLSVGFLAGGQVLATPVAGGSPEVLAPAPAGIAGATWTDAGAIVVAPLGGDGLVQIPAGGGAPEPLTRVAREEGELAHGWPVMVPGRNAVVFTVARRGRETRLAVLDVETRRREWLLPATGRAGFATSDRLVYALDRNLMLARFDPAELAIRGGPSTQDVQVWSDPAALSGLGEARFGLSRSFDLAYVPADEARGRDVLVKVDRDGRSTPVADREAQHSTPRVGPDGAIAVSIRTGVLTRDIWLYPGAGEPFPLTAGAGDNHAPVWRPGRPAVVFSSNRTGSSAIWSAAVGGREPELLLSGSSAGVPASWSADGRTLAYYRIEGAQRDIWIWDAGRPPEPLVRTPADERSPMLSPDGRWLAYVSDASGIDEVYLRRLREAGSERVSEGGGTEPRWGPSGDELYFRSGARMRRARVAGDGRLPAAVETLFDREFERDPAGNLPDYDVMEEGFLMIEPVSPANRLKLILDWAPAAR